MHWRGLLQYSARLMRSMLGRTGLERTGCCVYARAAGQHSGTPSRTISTRTADLSRARLLCKQTRWRILGLVAHDVALELEAKGTATPLVRRSHKAPRSAPCRSHSLTKPREQSE